MQNAFLKHFVFVVVASFSRDNVTMKFCSSGKVDEQFFLSKKYICSKVKTTRHRAATPPPTSPQKDANSAKTFEVLLAFCWRFILSFDSQIYVFLFQKKTSY